MIHRLICALVFVATVTLSAAVIAVPCVDSSCSKDCKEHNRWCLGGGDGIKYYSDVAFDDYCSEFPDGGTAGELDLVGNDQYPNCTNDCDGDVLTTGAPSGEKTTGLPVTLHTTCGSMGTSEG